MNAMEIGDILRYLPHRYPFLLLDRVLECVPNERIVALKNVTINEPFFTGHFPERPVMPAVMILEAMAQATGVLAMKGLDQLPTEQSLYYFVGIDKSRFRQPVGPGDQLRIEVTNLNFNDARLYVLRGSGSRQSLGRVGGKQDATFDITWRLDEDIRIQIDLLAGGSCTTQRLRVAPGDIIELQIAAVFRQSSFCF